MTPTEHDDDLLDDAALEALADAYAMPAPPALRERVLGLARYDRELRRNARSLRRGRMVGAMAAGIALMLGALLVREIEAGHERGASLAGVLRENAALEARLEEQGRTLASVREALDAQTAVLRIVGGPRIRSASLAPQGGAVGGGRVLVDVGSGEVALVLSDVAAPAEGRTYELWAIRGKRPPEPAGLIAVGSDRGAATRMSRVERPNEVTAFAVSIEPTGGSPAPTGPVVMVGPLTG